MKKIAIESLEADHVFSTPVSRDKDNLFIATNTPLEQKGIDRVMRWNIQEVFIEGEIIDGPSVTQAKGAREAGQNVSESRSSQPEWRREGGRGGGSGSGNGFLCDNH
jgi:hypothetical protein